MSRTHRAHRATTSHTQKARHSLASAVQWARQAGIEHGLKPRQRHVLSELTAHAIKSPHAHPAVERLALITGYSVPTIRRTLRELAEAKLIEDEGERVGKTQQVTVWTLCMPQPESRKSEAEQVTAEGEQLTRESRKSEAEQVTAEGEQLTRESRKSGEAANKKERTLKEGRATRPGSAAVAASVFFKTSPTANSQQPTAPSDATRARIAQIKQQQAERRLAQNSVSMLSVASVLSSAAFAH